MEANEVRLGNRLILSDGSNEFPITVEPHDFQQMLDGDRLYEPIPLTPEILEKCGLNSPLAVLSHNRDFVITGTEYDYNGVYIGKIEYLHQLQNLYFALTGQELTVNL